MRVTIVRLVIILIFTTTSGIISAKNNNLGQEGNIKYYNKNYFLIEGTTFPDSVKENTFDRFPFSTKEKVRPTIWNLSKASAGISIRFFTNSSSIRVKWELMIDTKMSHMAETGIKGIDLYCNTYTQWQYVNTAKPAGKTNEFLLVNNLKPEFREFKMYLPLYDGVINLEIGIDSMAQIVKPDAKNQKPIVFYGTSITQGCSASRPGMVHTNIISRKLNVECINFGFNGNGKMEKSVAEIMSDIDASFFVIDGTANMTPAEIHENTIPMVEIIREKHPSTPIVFVECLMFEKAFFEDSTRNFVNSRNNALKTEFEKMTSVGISNLYYIENRDAIGSDHEATVDGVHFTDLGYLRYADFLIAKFDELNLINTIKNEK